MNDDDKKPPLPGRRARFYPRQRMVLVRCPACGTRGHPLTPKAVFSWRCSKCLQVHTVFVYSGRP